jgi:hypothetical protein
MKKKAKKPSTRRSKKGAMKDLEPKVNPKGGLNFTAPLVSSFDAIKVPQLPGALKIDYHK